MRDIFVVTGHLCILVAVATSRIPTGDKVAERYAHCTSARFLVGALHQSYAGCPRRGWGRGEGTSGCCLSWQLLLKSSL